MRYYIIFSLLVLSLQGFSKTHPPKIDLKEVIYKLNEFNDPTVTRNLEGDFFKNLRFQNDSIAYFNPNGTLHLFKIKFGSTVNIEKISKGIYHEVHSIDIYSIMKIKYIHLAGKVFGLHVQNF